MSDLAGRVALVTGSTRGVGHAIARRLVEEGATVVVHGREAEAVKVVALAVGAVGVTGDLSTTRGAVALLDAAVRQVGPVEVLVNNAGSSSAGRFEDTPAGVWDHLFAVNFTGPRQLVAAALPGMRERRWGRILNVVSAAAVEGAPGFAAYAASKGALLSLTLTLAAEVARHGITVNALAPLALTDMVRSQLPAAAVDRLAEGGFPSLEECATAATDLLGDPARTGELTVMRLRQDQSGPGASA